MAVVNPWPVTRLGDVAQVDFGLPGAIETDRTAGTAMVAVSNITGDGDLKLNSHPLVDPVRVLERKMLRQGDLLFNWRNGSKALLGKTAIFREKEPFTFASFLLRIRTHPSMSPEFLLHYLRHLKDQGRFQRSKEQINKTFNSREVKDLTIIIPPMNEQMALVESLKPVDQARREFIQLWEAARTYRNALLVQLYSGYRLKGFAEPAPRQSFDRFVQWVREGRTHNGSSVELRNLESKTGRLLGVTSKRFQGKKWKFQRRDVLFSKLRPRVEKYHLAAKKGVCSNEILVLRAIRGICDPYWLYGLIRTPDFINGATTAGATIPRTSWKNLAQTRWQLPPLAEQKAIGSMLRLADAKVEEARNCLENQRVIYREVRDALFSQNGPG